MVHYNLPSRSLKAIRKDHIISPSEAQRFTKNQISAMMNQRDAQRYYYHESLHNGVRPSINMKERFDSQMLIKRKAKSRLELDNDKTKQL